MILKKGQKPATLQKSKISQKSIRTDFVKVVAVLFTIAIAALTALAIYFIQQSTTQSLEKSMRETSDLVAEKITIQIKEFGTIAETIGDYYVQSADGKDNKDYLSKVSQREGYDQIDIISTADQKSVLSGNKYDSDSTGVELTGNAATLSEPIVDGENVFFQYTYPYKQYIITISIPYSFFEEIIQSVQVGTTGSTYILDKTGTKVIHNDKTLVIGRQNNLEDVKKDPKLYKEVAELETNMTNGKSGFGFYTWKGDKKFGSYAPIEGTQGWSVNVTALESEFMSKLQVSLIFMISTGLIILAVAIAAVWRTSGNIVKPIRTMLKAVDRVYEGDLSIEFDISRRDEVGLMSEKLNGMVATYRTIIEDISTVLEALAHQDLTVSTQADYPGDFKKLKTSLATIVNVLNETFSQFSEASSQVKAGAEQVSSGAQALAQGASEQASTIEELSATMESVSTQINATAQDANNSDVKMEHVETELKECNTKMQEMVAAMKEINDTSSEISAIIKTIEDIAFQTNILALNAAVEAARAGENGKGFVVVADEVRNLAGKSADAAQNTTLLIQRSIGAVQKGSSLADETASSLDKTVTLADDVSELMKRISSSSGEQAASVNQINEGIEQVSSVVQNNSATSEESAAASEELLAQADSLQNRVNSFHLK